MPFEAIIIGSGFSGIGMAIQLRKHGVSDVLILERGDDVGGVWRDNSYPGAACDVPSHLYSFSFEPNPTWSHVFAPQREIHDYLRHCARKYDILPRIRFGAEVAAARFDEQRSVWRVELVDGGTVEGEILISGTGQLSRPALPAIEGIDRFAGRRFHSARWDHGFALAGKRVAVIGTGASAIQFVPAIAGSVRSLSLFQRSATYILPRPDRAYAPATRRMFARLPFVMRLYRASIYLRYESRAIAFTRFKGLMAGSIGRPFLALLHSQVRDPARRAKLMPTDPIGCKRILLSSDYYPALARPNVELVTEGIRRIYETGVETVDGRRHDCDAIIFGTGFAATDFLAPMRIHGRGGVELSDAWRHGAMAYLGLSVPDFPNFFMLYGPNTNLGHNSIVYMLESQIAHVVACLRHRRRIGAAQVEVRAEPYASVNANVHTRLARTVWNGCKSWYVDANGHNSTNWPGFTFTYRRMVKRPDLAAYRFATPVAGLRDAYAIAEPAVRGERLAAGGLRAFLRASFRPLIGPPWPVRAQRGVVALLSPLMPGVADSRRTRVTIGGVTCERIAPTTDEAAGIILYLHGGAFCLGSPRSHRSITTRLARDAGLAVIVPDYRLAPEHPWPAALDDLTAVCLALIRQGHAPERLVLAGDSAGGRLALDLADRLRTRHDFRVAALALISPVVHLDARRRGSAAPVADPMVRTAWLEQATAWYRGDDATDPLDRDPRMLPPLLIEVGRDEILLGDSIALARHAAAGDVACALEIHDGRWHAFPLQAAWLASSRHALSRLAAFSRRSVDVGP